MSRITSVPVGELFTFGANTTLMVQTELTANELGQLLVSVNSCEPLMSISPIKSGVVPVLVTVTDMVDFCPTFTLPKLKLVWLSVALGLTTVAVRLTFCDCLESCR